MRYVLQIRCGDRRLRWCGLDGRHAASQRQRSRADKGIPDTFPHGSGARRGGSRARQPGRRSLEVAYVRYRQGRRLPVDEPAAEILAREAIDAVYELEHRGLPFNRTADGRIDQRRFGGHTRNYGESAVRRSCYAADRTGHMILQTMYQSAIKNQVRFFNEYLALDLLLNDGQACGVVALEIRTGEIHTFHAKAVLFATGGYGRAWRVTSNAFACMGDGMAIAYRRGIPLEDMEMYQFHPTGIYKVGVLLSEAARGEGGKLLNGKGEYFMERYMPTLKDLAPRDIVSRSMIQEVKEGRGVDGKDYVFLDLRHLGAKII